MCFEETFHFQDAGASRKAYRARKNAKRKAARRRIAESFARPPVVALTRAEYRAAFGTCEGYDGYADMFISGAKKAHRRYVFPPEPCVIAREISP